MSDPNDYVVMPKEPTKEMVQRACDDHGYPSGDSSNFSRGYKSMLSASPPTDLVLITSEELSLLRKDAERLDWIIGEGCLVATECNGNFSLWECERSHPLNGESKAAVFKSGREAIDAALTSTT